MTAYVSKLARWTHATGVVVLARRLLLLAAVGLAAACIPAAGAAGVNPVSASKTSKARP